MNIPFISGGDDPFFPEEYPWADDEYGLKDAVLVDNDDFLLTAKEAKMDDFGDIQVLFTLENKSGKAVEISLRELYVNGLKFSGYVNEKADPESSIDFELEIDPYEMQDNAQEHVYCLDMFFEIDEKDNWFGDPLLKDHYQVVLQDGEAEAPAFDDALKLIGAEDLAAHWIDSVEASEWGSVEISFFCRNDKDIPVEFEVTELSVNGKEFEDIWWQLALQPGYAGLCSDTVSSDFLKDNGIEKITSLEGVIRVFSEDEDWNETVYEENEFSISYESGTVKIEIKAAE